MPISVPNSSSWERACVARLWREPRDLPFWLGVAVGGLTLASALGEILFPDQALALVGVTPTATLRFAFLTESVLTGLFGGALLHALLGGTPQPLVVLWVGLQKVAGVALTLMGVLQKTLAPSALAAAAFDLAAGALVFWLWFHLRGQPASAVPAASAGGGRVTVLEGGSMRDLKLIRLGGYFALLTAATQIGGNALHPPIPRDTVAALGVIHATTIWPIVHLVITVSYFLFIPFAIGASAAFKQQSWLVRLATPLVIVGAAMGVVQITTHLTIFHYIAMQYATASPAVQQTLAMNYDMLWPYSVALEVAHLLTIFVAVGLFGIAMLDEPLFPRWIGIIGIIGGVVAVAGISVGKFVINNTTGDLIFGFSLLPLMVWIVALGIVLLKVTPAQLAAADATPRPTAAPQQQTTRV